MNIISQLAQRNIIHKAVKKYLGNPAKTILHQELEWLLSWSSNSEAA